MKDIKIKKFSKLSKDKYSLYKQLFSKIEKQLTDLIKFTPWEFTLDPQIIIAGSPLYKTYLLIVCGTLRVIDVANGIIMVVNTNNTRCMSSLIRIQFETCGLLALLHKVLRCYKEINNSEEFDNKLSKLLLGGKVIGNINPFNSMDMIRAIDSEMSKAEDQEDTKPFESMYNELCEELHPNWAAIMGQYYRMNDDHHDFVIQEPLSIDEMKRNLNYMYVSLYAYEYFASRCSTLIKLVPNSHLKLQRK